MAKEKTKPWLRIEIVLIGLIVFMTFCVGCLLFLPLNMLSPSNSVISTSPTKILENKSTFPDPIPGITYNGVVSHLNQIGITCEPIKRDAVSYSGVCKGISSDGLTDVQVEVYSGNRPEDIYLILASVSQLKEYPSDQITIDILGYIATIPYDNAEPNRASSWVKKTVTMKTLEEDEPAELFGGVMFHMPCLNPNLQCLAIGRGSGSPP